VTALTGHRRFFPRVLRSGPDSDLRTHWGFHFSGH
jgi:hypothetical protein